MNITFVRHGEVEKSYQGKYNGHNDIALSQNGKAQARELGEKLKKMKFDKIYCSDLKRAKETLNEFNLNLPTIFTDSLREKSWGIHEGKSFEEIESMGIKYKNFEQWIDELDGEEVKSYTKRLKDYFYNTIAKESDKNILVVTHAGVIKTLISITKNITLEVAFGIKIDYGSIYKFKI